MSARDHCSASRVTFRLRGMFDQSSIPAWTAIGAVAALCQFGALVATAVFVWRYLMATEALRDVARKQLDAANEQLETQMRPVIAVKPDPPTSLKLVNLGKGPAFDLVVSPADRGSEGSRRWSERERFNDFVFEPFFIEVGAERQTNIHTQAVHGLAGVPVLNGQSLQCEYRSLSGRTYWTVVDFDHATGTAIIATRFASEPRT